MKKGPFPHNSLGLLGLVIISIIMPVAVKADDSVMALNQEGVRLAREGKLTEAERLFKKAIKQDPKDGAARNNMGFVYEKNKKYEKAIAEYEKAVELSQDPVVLKQAHRNLALLYLNDEIKEPIRKPDWINKFIRHGEELYKFEPDDPALNFYLGTAYFNTGNPGGGFEKLAKSSKLAKDEKYLWIHEQLVEFYARINLKDKLKEEEKLLKSYQKKVR